MDERDIVRTVDELMVRANRGIGYLNGHGGPSGGNLKDVATVYDEVLRAFSTTQAELAAANEQLGRNRIGTHGPDCWSYGPRHNECLMREFVALRARVVEVGKASIHAKPGWFTALSNLVKEVESGT